MSLRKKAASGAKWSALSSGIGAGLNLIKLGILARILSHEAFGLMSMMMVVIGFANAYKDMGISNAIIQRQETTAKQLSSLYWLNLVAGLAIFIIVLLAIPLISSFYNEPKLNDLLVWTSLLFLITPLGQQFAIMLKKELLFKYLSIVIISSSVTGTVVAVVSAVLGYGVYSLIWGYLANAIVRTIAFIFIGFSKWPPSLHFKFEDLRGYIGFGMYQMGEKTLNYLEKNIDYILIGRYLGPEILGAYTVAYEIVIKPVQKITPVLTSVAFPVFSKRQNNNASLRSGYLELCKMLILIIYPLLVGLAVVAPIAIPLFLGDGWQLSTILTQILVLLALARTLHGPSGILYLAKGRADIGFKFNLGVALINVVVYWIAVQRGVVALSLTAAVMNVFYFIILQFIIGNLINLSWKSYLEKFYIQFIILFIMAIAIYSVRIIFDSILNYKLLLGLLVITGGAIYVGGILLIEEEFVKEIRKLLTSKVKTTS